MSKNIIHEKERNVKREAESDRMIYLCVILLLVYVIGIIGCLVMKRIQPENTWYAIYVLGVCGMVTVFLMYHVFVGQVH